MICRNKAAIVQAGAVHKMLRIAEAASGALTAALVANFLCLSALDANKPIIGASGAAPFLVRAFEAAATEQVRHDALRALLNLSIAAANAPHLLAAGLAPSLLAAVGDMSASDRALVLELSERVRETVQRALYANLVKRGNPFL